MTRMVPLDGAYKVEVAGQLGLRTYRKGRDGTIAVDRPADVRALRREGLAVPASATGPVAHLPGFACGKCGRRNYFRACGRCGSDNAIKE